MVSKHTLKFKDLNCYKCAEKIKNELLKISYISQINVDVLNQKLDLELNNSSNLDRKLEDIKKLCVQIEPEMNFVDSNKNTNNKLYPFTFGIFLFIISFFFKSSVQFSFLICFISYILIGSNVLKKTLFNLKKGILFDENTLMTIATIGAFLIGEFQEAVAVMIFSRIGEFIQDKAINKSRLSISKLMDIKPEIANLEIENSIKTVHPSEIKIGDIIVVKPGEKIPLDGEIIFGESSLDTRALTGEFLPKEVKKDDLVLSGCINIDSLIKIKVSSEFKDSTVLKILNLVENAHSRKSNTENFITKFSKIYTPIVVLTAFLIGILPPLLITEATFSTWIYRALIFLVISCPCALVISIPLSFFSGIGVASKNGILIKGSNYLEALNNISTIIFDKTGTLTEGKFFITKIQNKNCEKDELIELAALAESFSNHPIAKSILDYYNKDIDKSQIIKYEEIPGHGIIVNLENDTIIAGNNKIMNKFNINILDSTEDIGTKIYIAKNNLYMGYILISDKIKNNSSKTISNLKKIGIQDIIMLTGDNKKIAEKICNEIGITKFYPELLPNQKVEYVEKFTKTKKSKSNLIFVGDGINDAPSLAIADVGISMGSMGSDAAIEASDVVLIDDDPYKIIKAIKIANQTRKISIQNIVISLGVKLLVLFLGTLGLSSMWAAILSDVGVSIIVILNSVKILNKKI